MNIFTKIKYLLISKQELPPCGNDGEVMWCYCGKCKQKDYELPEDLKKNIKIKAVEIYNKDLLENGIIKILQKNKYERNIL